MSASAQVPEPLRDLIDDYLSGLLDEGGVRRLEEALRGDPEARAYFVRYARLHTDLHLEARAIGIAAGGERVVLRAEHMGTEVAGVQADTAGIGHGHVSGQTATAGTDFPRHDGA